MKMSKLPLLGVVVIVVVNLVVGLLVHENYKRDMKRFYKDGFRVGRVIGRDDVMLKLKRPDCFKQSLDEIVLDGNQEEFKKIDAILLEKHK